MNHGLKTFSKGYNLGQRLVTSKESIVQGRVETSKQLIDGQIEPKSVNVRSPRGRTR